MVADAEATRRELGLTYRILLQCTGDLSRSQRKTYDIEVQVPGCKEWLKSHPFPN